MTAHHPDRRRSAILARFTESEYDVLQTAADTAGISMAEYIRRAVNRYQTDTND